MNLFCIFAEVQVFFMVLIAFNSHLFPAGMLPFII